MAQNNKIQKQQQQNNRQPFHEEVKILMLILEQNIRML